MKNQYDVVVIGTGFGGAVASARLAQAGLSVGILERGRRYRAEDFPVMPSRVESLWSHGRGLFDLKSLDGMLVVQSAGYGGGSLIYANVHLRPPPEVFAESWPSGFTRAALDPYFDLVAHMLEIAPITAGSRPLPKKTERMRVVADRLERSDDFFYPPLAIRFAEKGKNRFGIEQDSCNYCGQCDVGCARGAKNTLDLNYLAVAEQLGAEVRTESEVLRLVPRGSGYRVFYRGADEVESWVDAAQIFLCAGAVNTVELLLRCRDQYRTLPELSQCLGHGYSGNGDYLAFGVGAEEPFDPTRGPTITTGLRYDARTNGDRGYFLFQDGGHPELRIFMEASRLLGRKLGLERLADECADELARELSGTDRNAVFLAMGRDSSNGVIELLPRTHELKIRWEHEKNRPLYQLQERLAADVAGALEAELVLNPVWRLFQRPVSVHSLGGCRIGARPEHSVLSEDGEAHGYPGLFVLDGAAIPAATGVNPSSTIAALAERNVERFIRRRKHDPSWQAPEQRALQRFQDPLSLLGSLGRSAPPETPLVGVRFTERMTGHFLLGVAPSNPLAIREYEAAEREGRGRKQVVDFTLTITLANLDTTSDRLSAHAGRAEGHLRADGVAARATVRDGVFHLFIPPEDGAALAADRRMLYALPFLGDDGRPYLLDGFKRVRDDGSTGVWPATTTLYSVLREGHDRRGPVLGMGIVRIRARDFLKQLTTLRVIGTGGVALRGEHAVRFARMFFGGLWDVYVDPRIETTSEVRHG